MSYYLSFVRASLLLGLALVSTAAAHAQAADSGDVPRQYSRELQNPTPRQPDLITKYGADPASARAAMEAAELQNELRQKILVSATDELVQLTRELQAEAAKNPHAMPTPLEAAKLKEIQKLAKTVKERMKAE
jgi:hypothetical protein